MNQLFRIRSAPHISKFVFIFIVLISIELFIWWTVHLFKNKECDGDKIFVSLKNNIQQTNSFYVIGQPEIGRIASLYFPSFTVVYTNGIAYDLYSIRELGQLEPALQWLTFPLPDEVNNIEPWMPQEYSHEAFPFLQSPSTRSGLAYIDQIYVLSDPSLSDRIENMKHMFVRHDISIESINWWRLGKWNQQTCNAEENQAEVYRILNLNNGSIGGDTEKRYCAVTVQHVEVWREIAATDSTVALILEDDAIFVPFFKEKFNRFIYTAIRTGALKIDSQQCALSRTNASENEWINQDPAFVIGACGNLQDSNFPVDLHNASPRITAHKERFSRCSHAYILTSCSAKEMVRLIDANKMHFQILDWLQTYLGEISLTLQPFWLDPPLAYQGSQCQDLDGIPTFGHSMP